MGKAGDWSFFGTLDSCLCVLSWSRGVFSVSGLVLFSDKRVSAVSLQPKEGERETCVCFACGSLVKSFEEEEEEDAQTREDGDIN